MKISARVHQCTRKGCHQCALLKSIAEDLHPRDLPERLSWTYEPDANLDGQSPASSETSPAQRPAEDAV